MTINDVTYRIEIWRDETLLAMNSYFDDDGTLDIKIRPVMDCSDVKPSKCTRYYGTLHPGIPNTFFDLGGAPIIEGPIFDKGGLYNIKTIIPYATSPKTPLASELNYETFVSIAQEQFFTVQTAEAAVPIVMKTYYDDVYGVEYELVDNSITFSMPFDWSPEYIENVVMVHEELQIPKTVEPYNKTKQFRGYVNGIEVDRRVLVLDPFTIDDHNILHFLVSGNELKRINSILGEDHEHSKVMNFKIIPEDSKIKNLVEFYLVDIDTREPVGTTIDISWDAAHTAGDTIPFEIVFLDQDGDLIKNVKYAFSLFGPDGQRIIDGGVRMNDPADIGILAQEGIDIQEITIQDAGMHRLDIAVFGGGINYEQTYAGIGSALIEIGEAHQQTVNDVVIPAWIKSSVGFWVEGATSDAEFIGAIQYLIENKIITVPTTKVDGSGGEIPAWIKSSAGFWVEGATSDAEFIGALQFLIGKGIIVT